MINGAHVVIQSKNPEADRSFLRDTVGLPSVDVGDGWLIFGLPPSEVAVHPEVGGGAAHELYFMCEDIDALRATLVAKGVACTEVDDQGWGKLIRLTLPGGGALGVYEPRHARPDNPA